MSESSAKVQTLPLVEGQAVTGLLFSEPMRVETIRQSEPGTWVRPLDRLREQNVLRVFVCAIAPNSSASASRVSRVSSVVD